MPVGWPGAAISSPAVEAAVRRLDEPLRVAIAGRTKAGKSTLLNALVGERLAATDASECTRIVTWYRHALGYRVAAELRAGGTARAALPAPRRRPRDRARRARPRGAIERIEVGWPSRKLADLTLIDTPGLGSADEGVSARTAEALLDEDGDRPGEADAVIYLMRHLHRYDAQFLEAFIDHSLAHASPINAIVVLSRADEIGAARPDALESARAVGRRYAADRRIRELASGVVPVAGLIAETGATLREQQVAWLRQIAALDEPTAGRRSCAPSTGSATPTSTRSGRTSARSSSSGSACSACAWPSVCSSEGGSDRDRAVRRRSSAISGISELQRILDDRFAARSDALKARSALAALRGVADELGRRATPGRPTWPPTSSGSRPAPSSSRCSGCSISSWPGWSRSSADERLEIDRLTGSGSAGERVGLAEMPSPEAIRAAALAGIERWRMRAANPLSDRRTIEAAEIVDPRLRADPRRGDLIVAGP